MPKLFIDTFDGKIVFDDEGYELPDRAAVRDKVKRVLFDLMSREKTDHNGTRLRADVRNEAGKLVMTARLVMTMDDFGGHV